MLTLGLCQFVFAQNITVSGKVTNEDDEPLIGATVLIEGTSSGVFTNDDGVYTISAPSDGVLIFSYTGYSPQTVEINGNNAVNVKMTGSLTMEEVVVVGYGTMERTNVTGAITTVDVEAIPSHRIGRNSTGNLPSVRTFPMGITLSWIWEAPTGSFL